MVSDWAHNVNVCRALSGCRLVSCSVYMPLLLQIHIKAGTVTPMQEPGLTAAASKVGAYSLLVALNDAGKAQGDLFLDDGESIDETLRFVGHLGGVV